MEGRHAHRGADESDELAVNPLFARPGEETVPRWRIPDGEMLPDMAYQIIHDEVLLDGNARQNLATFVSTWMEPQATQLYAESFDKNMIDKDEYPQTAAIEDRCIHILADLWNSPEPHSTIGTSAIGSSEACMLAGLAFKRRWQQRRKAEKKPFDAPNIVFSSAVQVVWEKFANYWDVEPRYVPITKAEPYLTPEGMLEVVDENTIGVVAILGVTYNGVYEPVKEIAGGARRPRRAHRAGYPAARRRSVGRVHRSLPRSRPRVGLPPASGSLHQHVGTQVRVGVPGPRMGRVVEGANTFRRT